MKSVNDVGSMSLSTLNDVMPNFMFIVSLNSNLLFDYYREFINCTVNIQINDIRQIPIIIPTKEQMRDCKILFNKAISLKKSVANGTATDFEIQKELTEVETKLDNFVNNLYGI